MSHHSNDHAFINKLTLGSNASRFCVAAARGHPRDCGFQCRWGRGGGRDVGGRVVGGGGDGMSMTARAGADGAALAVEAGGRQRRLGREASGGEQRLG